MIFFIEKRGVFSKSIATISLIKKWKKKSFAVKNKIIYAVEKITKKNQLVTFACRKDLAKTRKNRLITTKKQ